MFVVMNFVLRCQFSLTLDSYT